ncbi:MAG TPA: hypothetical protein VG757_03995 [Devosia sp.]|nr:hypothetical protein [Devosia sp.]
MQNLETPRRRQGDRSNAEARRAIEGTLARFSSWQEDLARFWALVERQYSAVEGEAMLARCTTIAHEVQQARVALIEALVDAPRRVAGHSRVADVEKALDGVEAMLEGIRRRMKQ